MSCFSPSTQSVLCPYECLCTLVGIGNSCYVVELGTLFLQDGKMGEYLQLRHTHHMCLACSALLAGSLVSASPWAFRSFVLCSG